MRVLCSLEKSAKSTRTQRKRATDKLIVTFSPQDQSDWLLAAMVGFPDLRAKASVRAALLPT